MNPQEQRTRAILLVIVAIFVTLFICGQCVFDAGVAIQVGAFNNCVYPPHVCQQP